jgi:hypothetical protein
MAVRACVYCIESGDDLGPFHTGSPWGLWMGVDGRLRDHFFIADFGLIKDVKKNEHHAWEASADKYLERYDVLRRMNKLDTWF